MNGIARYLPTAVVAIGRVGLITGVGVVAAREGILDEKTRKGVARLCKDWLLPLLLLSQVPPSIDFERLSRFWVLPVAASLYCSLGYLLGSAYCCAVGVDARHRSLVVAACALPTTTGPVLALLGAVVAAAPGLADRDAQLATGTAAVLVYTAFMSIFRWTVGWHLMAPPPVGSYAQDEDLLDVGTSRGEMESLACAPSEPEASSPSELSTPKPSNTPSVGPGCAAALRKAVVNRPVLSALAALALAFIPALGPIMYDDAALLRPSVTDSMLLLGGAYVPCSMMCLGSQLSHGPSPGGLRGGAPSSSAPGQLPIGVRAVAGVVVVRMLVVPAIAATAAYFVQQLQPSCSSTVLVADGDNSTGAVAARAGQASSCTVVEPTVLIVLLLESAGPPAINLGVMALLHAWREAATAALLFWTYLVAVVTITGWCVVFVDIAY